MKTLFLKIIALLLVSSTAFSATTSAATPPPKTKTPPPAPEQTPPAQVAPKEIPAEALPEKAPAVKPAAPEERKGCAALSEDEQAFADQLSPLNKILFCEKFSPELRKTALNMVGKLNAQGEKVTPDQAVALLTSQHDLSSEMKEPTPKENDTTKTDK